MSSSNTKNVEILDCTIRDGGYINNWQFDKKLVREVYRSVSKSGIDIMEIGFRGTDKYFDRKKYGLWRFTDEDVLREVIKGIHGAKIALMADFGRIDADDFIEAKDSAVDIVRVAANGKDLFDAIGLLEKIKAKGYKVSLNAMGYSNYACSDRKKILSALKKSEVDFFYVVDSYGSMFPDEIAPIVSPLLEIPKIKVGFHPHNSLQMAFANSLEAIRCGVHLIDSTLYGIGRGAGNLPTEIVVLYMELLGIKKYNVIPVLNCIDTYFLPMKRELDWGYQLHFMLSGMYKCHPNYAKNLIESHEHTIEDICRGMEFINKLNPSGYSEDTLKKVIEERLVGRINNSPDENNAHRVKNKKVLVQYKDRHKDADFLILANGPTLKEYKEKVDIFIKKIDPIILGANNLSELFVPHYHAFNNKKRFITYIDSVSKKSKLFLSQYFSTDLIKEYGIVNYEKFYYEDTLNSSFDIKGDIVQTNCRTISILLIGIAIVMGAKRIFIAGMDGYLHYLLNGKFFYYDEKNELVDKKMIIDKHKWCQRFLEQIDSYLIKNNKEGLHVLTPTDYKAFYKGIENYI